MSRLIQWFIENKVAANLLMVLIFVGCFFSFSELNKEVFPVVERNIIQVNMNYPGAGPTEVEQLVAIRIEEAVADLEGVYALSSKSRQGYAQVFIEVAEGYDPQQLLNDVKTRIDAINSFPADVERPVASRQISRSQLMSIALYGNVDEAALKETGMNLRNELALLPGISMVQLNGTRPYEMGIEISEHNLRRYQLSFDQVAQAIRQTSVNIPAGTIRTVDGDIQLQARSQAYSAEDFARIPVLTHPDGSKVLLGDIATIDDGFSDWTLLAQYNGAPAVFLELSISEDPDILAATKTVKDYIEQVRPVLPAGVQIDIWRDMSTLFQARLDLLLSNAISGLILVLVVLMLFLRPQIAIWVAVGIATAFAGAIWMLPYLGVSINMISLFAFLLVLGIVVDDAIIVGESIYTRQQHGLRGAASAASGAKMVSVPVFFSVASTMIFFVPMLDVPGNMAVLARAIGIVVLLCLLFSLIESLLILPSHLSHMQPEQPSRYSLLKALDWLRERVSYWLNYFIDQHYTPLLKRLMAYKGATILGFVMAFGISLALFAGGWLKSSFMPKVPGDTVEARLVMPEGTSFNETQRIMRKVQDAALLLREDETLRSKNGGDFVRAVQTWANGVNIYMAVALQDAETRIVGVDEVSRRWQELIGDVPEAKEFRLDFTLNASGDDIRLNLSINSNRFDDQQAVADTVSASLAAYPHVFDVKTSLQASRPEIDLRLKPNAEMLGITLNQVARQVRQAFYGEEAQRIPRGSEDVRVLVRYPEEDRRQLDQINHMRIRTATGVEVPLLEVAEIVFVPGYTIIDRRDRKRNITVTARVGSEGDAQAIVRAMNQQFYLDWQRQYPGFSLQPDGNMRDQADFQKSLLTNFLLALLVIYMMMAVSFRSYSQSLIVLTAVPFGFMGAVIGHLVMDREISMLSMLGFIACAGVVVNDNLVLLDRINQLRAQGLEIYDAVVQAGRDRFRAILLTSLTTFVGLMPIMAEQSVQARFLIPMVISLAFGVLFATLVTLILVPCLNLLAADISTRLRALRTPSGSADAASVHPVKPDHEHSQYD